MKLYTVMFAVVVFTGIVAGREDYIRYEVVSKYCSFQGYVPGGRKVTVERITAPTAQLEKNIFSGLAGNLGKASTGTMHLMNLMKGFGKLAVIAPKLGPALGLFGVGFSILKSLTDPSPQDILDAANKAINKLTEEVNNRLDEMKGYVEEKTINIEKDLINREYKSLFLLWSNCVKEVTKEDINECQEDAAKQIMAARPKFAIFSSQVQANADLTVYDVKRIEANLVTFRDYVVLSIACLSALTATYENDTTKHADYVRFANDLNNEIKFFVTYTENAVSMIVRMHVGGQNCKDTFKCGKMKHINEGFWNGVNTYDQTNCSCVIDRSEVSTHTCIYRMTVRVDGKIPGSKFFRLYETSSTSFFGAAQQLGSYFINKRSDDIKKKIKQTISNYWNNEVLDLVPSWKELEVNLENDQMLLEDEIMARRGVMVFSDNFERRQKQVTEQMARDGSNSFDYLEKGPYNDPRYGRFVQRFPAQDEMNVPRIPRQRLDEKEWMINYREFDTRGPRRGFKDTDFEF